MDSVVIMLVDETTHKKEQTRLSDAACFNGGVCFNGGDIDQILSSSSSFFLF